MGWIRSLPTMRTSSGLNAASPGTLSTAPKPRNGTRAVAGFLAGVSTHPMRDTAPEGRCDPTGSPAPGPRVLYRQAKQHWQSRARRSDRCRNCLSGRTTNGILPTDELRRQAGISGSSRVSGRDGGSVVICFMLARSRLASGLCDRTHWNKARHTSRIAARCLDPRKHGSVRSQPRHARSSWGK